MLGLTLLMLKRIWNRPTPDDTMQANEEMLARRALLVQAWAERNRVDLGDDATESESRDLDPVKDLDESSSIAQMDPEPDPGHTNENSHVQSPETTNVQNNLFH
jgi:hypothetical protein